MNFRPLQTLLLDRQPCCLEIYPDHPDILIVGTYNLVDDGSLVERDDQSTSPNVGSTEVQPVSSGTETGSSATVMDDGIKAPNRVAKDTDDSTSGADKSCFEGDDAKKSQRRNGSLELFKFQDGRLEAHSPALHLEYGVLDIHYEPRLQCFGAATSTGLIALFRISHEVGSQISMFSIQSIQSFRIVDPNTVLTCFAWNPKTVGSLAIGAASGEVFLVDLSVSTTVTQQKTPTPRQSHSIVSDRWRQIRINRHEESCWTVAFSILERSVYSGGDDSAFISTRYTSESDAQDATGNILSPRSVTSIHDSSSEPCEDLHRTCNYKLHRAGITAIVPLYNRLIQFSDECHELVEFLATGSYDECFRVVMARHGRGSFTELLELPLGGGVWRIKVMIQGYLKQFGRTFYVAYLSVSCMQAGARVIEVRCDHGSKIDCCWKAEVVAYYQDHGSLVYDTAFFYGHNGEPIPSDTGPAGFWIPELSESCEAKTSDPSQTSFEVSSESLQEASMKGLLRRVVTSSFYDKTLCVSHMKLLPCLEKPGRRHLGDEDNASF